MKFVRKFSDIETRDAVLAIVEYGVLSYTEGSGIKVKHEESGPVIDYSIPFYIEDISGSENTVQIKKNNSSAPTLAIEKSTDGNTWESMGSTTTSYITATVPANGKLYLRCSATQWGYSANKYNTIDTTGNCNVGGNAMSLLYGSSFSGQTEFPNASVEYIFNGLFYNNTHVVNAENLLLLATTLANCCYQYMFSGCTSLTTAPELPATTMVYYCYQYMFQGCTSLTAAPELPATTLINACYRSMFSGCTSLTTAPELPATALANSCYDSMFYGCTSLTTAPALPVTTLTDSCYYSMFSNCTSLTTAPALPATTLAKSCYQYMFQDCTSLTAAPALPATTAVESCYYSMFSGCTSLTTAPELPATALADSCYRSMFSGCTSLTTAPELPATTLANYCYQYMFYGCTSLTTAPALPATTLAKSCYYQMFYGCTLLTTAPSILPATKAVESCYYEMFRGCTSLTVAPALPATTLAKSCYYQMFYGCTSLTTAPALPATTAVESCYSGMFLGCTSLTVAPALPATTLANQCYIHMFKGCTSLTTAPSILPATYTREGCYSRMFEGCTSLTTAPVLPAKSLVNHCYFSMFLGCSNLNYIKCLATSIASGSTDRCTGDWTKDVKSSGTFIKDPSMSNWVTGYDGIPWNWTVKNQGSITLSQNLNVATIKIAELGSEIGYYTINGGSQVSLTDGTTTIPITQAMNGQTLLVHCEFGSGLDEKTLTLSWTDYTPEVSITETDNFVTITSATANTIQYKLGSSGEYTTYTSPVYIETDTTIYVIATRMVSDVAYTVNASQEVTHTALPPTNLTISCWNGMVTISADYASEIEYNTDGSSTYITYTGPFAITESVTVYAKATNSDGNITGSQQCVYEKPSNDEIWYLSSDGNIVTPSNANFGTGISVVSNTYSNGKGVIKLSGNATRAGLFRSNGKLVSIIIPGSVTAIDSYAFDNCRQLKSVDIPNGVEIIGQRSFGNCIALTSVTIPSSVTEILMLAFAGVSHIYYNGSASGSPWGAKAIN